MSQQTFDGQHRVARATRARAEHARPAGGRRRRLVEQQREVHGPVQKQHGLVLELAAGRRHVVLRDRRVRRHEAGRGLGAEVGERAVAHVAHPAVARARARVGASWAAGRGPRRAGAVLDDELRVAEARQINCAPVDAKNTAACEGVDDHGVLQALLDAAFVDAG